MLKALLDYVFEISEASHQDSRVDEVVVVHGDGPVVLVCVIDYKLYIGRHGCWLDW